MSTSDFSHVEAHNILAAAQAAHEVNRAYCTALGDKSQPPWDDAPDWQVRSCIDGVKGVINGTELPPEQNRKDDLFVSTVHALLAALETA